MRKIKKIILDSGLKNLSNADMTSLVGGCTREWHYFLGCSWQQEKFYVVNDCSGQTMMSYCNKIYGNYCVAVETI